MVARSAWKEPIPKIDVLGVDNAGAIDAPKIRHSGNTFLLTLAPHTKVDLFRVAQGGQEAPAATCALTQETDPKTKQPHLLNYPGTQDCLQLPESARNTYLKSRVTHAANRVAAEAILAVDRLNIASLKDSGQRVYTTQQRELVKEIAVQIVRNSLENVTPGSRLQIPVGEIISKAMLELANPAQDQSKGQIKGDEDQGCALTQELDPKTDQLLYLNYPGDADCRKPPPAFDRKTDALDRVAVEVYVELGRQNKDSLQATEKPRYTAQQTDKIMQIAKQLLSNAFAETIPQEALRIPVQAIIQSALEQNWVMEHQGSGKNR